MTTVSHNKIVEKAGINALITLVENRGSIYHPIHGENDIGCDARIEICEEKSIGVSFFVQVKSGNIHIR